MTLPKSLLTLDLNAQKKIVEILSNTPDKPHFRLQIKGGGCSGFEYVFGIDDTITERDFHQSINYGDDGFMMLIDAISYQYVQNASINFVSDASGERFVVSNPNAQTSCSCGSSFALKDPATDTNSGGT